MLADAIKATRVGLGFEQWLSGIASGLEILAAIAAVTKHVFAQNEEDRPDMKFWW